MGCSAVLVAEILQCMDSRKEFYDNRHIETMLRCKVAMHLLRVIFSWSVLVNRLQVRVRVCVCVCVCESETACVYVLCPSVCVFVEWAREPPPGVCVCMYMRERLCVCLLCVCLSICVRERARERESLCVCVLCVCVLCAREPPAGVCV